MTEYSKDPPEYDPRITSAGKQCNPEVLTEYRKETTETYYAMMGESPTQPIKRCTCSDCETQRWESDPAEELRPIPLSPWELAGFMRTKLADMGIWIVEYMEPPDDVDNNDVDVWHWMAHKATPGQWIDAAVKAHQAQDKP